MANLKIVFTFLTLLLSGCFVCASGTDYAESDLGRYARSYSDQYRCVLDGLGANLQTMLKQESAVNSQVITNLKNQCQAKQEEIETAAYTVYFNLLTDGFLGGADPESSADTNESKQDMILRMQKAKTAFSYLNIDADNIGIADVKALYTGGENDQHLSIARAYNVRTSHGGDDVSLYEMNFDDQVLDKLSNKMKALFLARLFVGGDDCDTIPICTHTSQYLKAHPELIQDYKRFVLASLSRVNQSDIDSLNNILSVDDEQFDLENVNPSQFNDLLLQVIKTIATDKVLVGQVAGDGVHSLRIAINHHSRDAIVIARNGQANRSYFAKIKRPSKKKIITFLKSILD